MLLFNPVVFSILVMTVLCLLRFNILLSILISALVAGVMYKHGFSGFESGLASGFESFFTALKETTQSLISGMQGNLETLFELRNLLIAFIKMAVKFVFAMAAARAPSKM